MTAAYDHGKTRDKSAFRFTETMGYDKSPAGFKAQVNALMVFVTVPIWLSLISIELLTAR